MIPTNCVGGKPMAAAQAAEEMAALAEKLSRYQGDDWGLGCWRGQVRGADSGAEFGPEHLAAFCEGQLLALFGPLHDERTERTAALLLLAYQNARAIAAELALLRQRLKRTERAAAELERFRSSAARAWDFYQLCRRDPGAGPTGARRDADEWVRGIVQELAAAPPGLESAVAPQPILACYRAEARRLWEEFDAALRDPHAGGEDGAQARAKHRIFDLVQRLAGVKREPVYTR